MPSLLAHQNNGREFPKYRSHKTVWAVKIKRITPEPYGQMKITPEEEGYEPFLVTSEYVRKHNPQAGGYLVVYADGYQSWSPAPQFDEGNIPYNEAAPPEYTDAFALMLNSPIPVVAEVARRHLEALNGLEEFLAYLRGYDPPRPAE